MKLQHICVLVLLTLGISVTAFGQQKFLNATVQDLEGKTEKLSSYTKEKITIVSCWATWCAPCKKELNAIAKEYAQWQKKYDVQLIALSVDKKRTFDRKVGGMAKKFGWKYIVLNDVNQEVQNAMNIRSVPYVFLLDKNGKIVYTHTEYKDGDEKKLEKKIAKLAKK